MKNSFNSIVTLVSSPQNPFLEELTEQIQGFVQIGSSILLDASHAYDTYSSRFHVQKNITKHDKVLGWEELLPKLEMELENKDVQVRLTNLNCENFGYLIFSNQEFDRLLGVLKFTNQRISRDKELTKEGKLKGNWNDSSFFLNGIEVNH